MLFQSNDKCYIFEVIMQEKASQTFKNGIEFGNSSPRFTT